MTQQQKSYDMHERNLFIAIPSYDWKVSLKSAISLARFAQSAPEHGVQMRIGSICGCSVISRARNLLAYDFLKSPCTDLLFIDSDINFTPDDVYRLMAWGTNHGIVAGVPTARKGDKVYIATLDKTDDNEVIMNSMGLVRATRVATAFMLIQRRVFETLQAAHPEWQHPEDKLDGNILTAFFDFKTTPAGYVGEDFLFCDRAREAGFEVWIDPTIKLGHMGITEYMGDFGNDLLYPMLVPVNKQDVA
jgi:hypothetical protein